MCFLSVAHGQMCRPGCNRDRRLPVQSVCSRFGIYSRYCVQRSRFFSALGLPLCFLEKHLSKLNSLLALENGTFICHPTCLAHIRFCRTLISSFVSWRRQGTLSFVTSGRAEFFTQGFLLCGWRKITCTVGDQRVFGSLSASKPKIDFWFSQICTEAKAQGSHYQTFFPTT